MIGRIFVMKRFKKVFAVGLSALCCMAVFAGCDDSSSSGSYSSSSSSSSSSYTAGLDAAKKDADEEYEQMGLRAIIFKGDDKNYYTIQFNTEENGGDMLDMYIYSPAGLRDRVAFRSDTAEIIEGDVAKDEFVDSANDEIIYYNVNINSDTTDVNDAFSVYYDKTGETVKLTIASKTAGWDD
jgi:hypothetical protein